MRASPFAFGYEAVYRGGIGTAFPLPANAKHPPPLGCTGTDAVPFTAARCRREAEDATFDANIGIRPAPGVLVLDVDCYDGKPGAASWWQLQSALGALPDGPVSTARPLPSGHRWFRCAATPDGSEMAPGIDFVWSGHRYAVAPPSRHPTGAVYRWHGTTHPNDAPALADLPTLPEGWQQAVSDESHPVRAALLGIAEPDSSRWHTSTARGERRRRVDPVAHDSWQRALGVQLGDVLPVRVTARRANRSRNSELHCDHASGEPGKPASWDPARLACRVWSTRWAGLPAGATYALVELWFWSKQGRLPTEEETAAALRPYTPIGNL